MNERPPGAERCRTVDHKEGREILADFPTLFDQKMLKKPIPSTGGKNWAKSERIFCARVPGCAGRKHFRMVRCSLLCNGPSADPIHSKSRFNNRNRASTLDIALQPSKSHINIQNHAPDIRNRASTLDIARQHSESHFNTRNHAPDIRSRAYQI